MTVTFINCFEVPAGDEEDFLARWEQVNCYMRAKEGYLDHTLYRSLGPDARFRFINTARWASAVALATAHDDGFRALVSGPEWRRYTSSPAMFESIQTGG